MKENKELFWDATIEDVKRGFTEDEDYKCIICEERFTKGRIYEIDNMLFDAKKATEIHIGKKHGSTLEYLLNMNTSLLGLTEVQKRIYYLISSGLSDKDIAKKLELLTLL